MLTITNAEKKCSFQENLDPGLMEVSVVITAMAEGDKPYIKECVSSIFRNEYIAEVIVCVIKNNDWIDQELKDFFDHPKLKIHRILPCNASAARNYGVRTAVSSWIAFCDGDDYWSDHKISKQLTHAIRHNLDVVGGDHWLTDIKSIVRSYSLCRVMPMTSSWLVKKEVMLKYPFNEKVARAEDSEWWVRVGSKIKKGRCPHLMLYYRVKTNSKSSGARSKERKAFIVKMASKPILSYVVKIFTFGIWILYRNNKYSL